MSDVFREVDEDLRRDKLKGFWQRYGRFVIAGAILIVLLVAAYTFWQSYQRQQAEAAGAEYYDALLLRATEGPEAAEAALAEIAAEGYGGYPTLAAMNVAALRAEMGDISGAVAGYDAIALDASVHQSLRTVARYRAAMLLVDTAPISEIQQRLEPLVVEGSPFRFLALEAMAVAAIRVEQYERAFEWLTRIAAAEDRPEDVYNRAARLFSVVVAHTPAETTVVTDNAPELGGLRNPGAPAEAPFLAPVEPEPAPTPGLRAPDAADTPTRDLPGAAGQPYLLPPPITFTEPPIGR